VQGGVQPEPIVVAVDELEIAIRRPVALGASPDRGVHLFAGLLVAAVIAKIGIRLGEISGQWMRQIYQ